MKLKHKTIQGQSLLIKPMMDKSYSNHSAFISVLHSWKGQSTKSSFSSVMRDQEAAINYARLHGYDVPVGF